MGARDSDDDIRKYLPDLDAIVREADPAAAEEKLRKAVDNPELDRALAELKRGLGQGESPFEFPTVPVAPSSAGAPDAPDAAPISAHLPAAPPPVTLPATPRGAIASPATDRRRPRLPGWLLSGLAVIAVLAPVTMMKMLETGSSSPEVGAPGSTTPARTSSATAPAVAPAGPPASAADAGATASPAAAAPPPGSSTSRPPPAPGEPPPAPARPAPVRPAPAPIATDIMH